MREGEGRAYGGDGFVAFSECLESVGVLGAVR